MDLGLIYDASFNGNLNALLELDTLCHNPIFDPFILIIIIILFIEKDKKMMMKNK
jgi:hypothetical protein